MIDYTILNISSIRTIIKKIFILIICINASSCCIQENPQNKVYIPQKIVLQTSSKKNIIFTKEALKQINKKYVYGGSSPQKGFDCSGLVYYCAKKSLNLNLPRTTKKLIKVGNQVSKRRVQTGDLVFFKTNHNQLHVGIYVKDDIFIHAPRTGKKIKFDNINSKYWSRKYITSRRICY
ncbi:Cell wall-associated hydrolase of the NlpC/P60 family [Candidatus Kinetoplastibacterium crithidii TCC036E]|uniref:Cell wall-associated hydrolase of the NlpC/P60 family n=1 Tax=Candidatus Kinetoplastidibacterium crithidiae TCC036E TaxID=1208918 RepID=M1LQ36_9PROT|nr:lipoprotein [Candidatus Kinetoplastibacterium crithidii (ex Angomonas deanei ATCC 30255)]AGF47732.1 Cell wall-associated hydrolase of the NlpC/P60 family [Candidatus Kinetoplastibacterium crithidii TCC036E]